MSRSAVRIRAPAPLQISNHDFGARIRTQGGRGKYSPALISNLGGDRSPQGFALRGASSPPLLMNLSTRPSLLRHSRFLFKVLCSGLLRQGFPHSQPLYDFRALGSTYL